MFQLFLSSTEDSLAIKLIYTFGFTPNKFNIFSIFTSLFLHGGFSHFIGNMWFLYIFGDNVESILGHLKYFYFYLSSGLFAALLHYPHNPSLLNPNDRSKRSNCWDLGAYLISFPKAQVHVFVMLFVFFTTLIVPAKIVLGIWFLVQLSEGFSEFGVISRG